MMGIVGHWYVRTVGPEQEREAQYDEQDARSPHQIALHSIQPSTASNGVGTQPASFQDSEVRDYGVPKARFSTRWIAARETPYCLAKSPRDTPSERL